MTVRGVDYSWARPGGAAIAAAGFEFAVRYIPYPGDGGKGLTIPERDDLHRHGISIAMVFESTAGRPLGGGSAGQADAKTSLAAMNALGFSADRPVYFAVDFDAEPAQYGAIDQYLWAAGNVLGPDRVGVYGSYAVIDHCVATENARWYWQAYAWSRGLKHPARHLFQYLNGQTLNGGAVDYNEAYGRDYGQWSVTQEEEMTEDDLLAIFAGGEETEPDPDTPGALRLKDREERLRLARFRRDEAAAGRAPSVRDIAAGSHSHPAGAGVSADKVARAIEIGAKAALTELRT